MYQAAVPYVNSLPIQDLPRAWVKPGTKMLTAMQPLDAMDEKLKMLGQQKDFLRKALWKTLTVGARPQKAYHQPNCVMCSVFETVNHVLSRCNFGLWHVILSPRPLARCGAQQTGAMCPMTPLITNHTGTSTVGCGTSLWVLTCEAKLRGVSSPVSDFVPT